MTRTRCVLLLTLIGASAGLGCSDLSPANSIAEPQWTEALLNNGLGKGLLRCSATDPAITTQTVGAEGGMLEIGPHLLTIPAGALTQPVEITAEAPQDSVNSVRLLPEGLVFAEGKPASLTLGYRNCSPLARLGLKRIAYTSDQLEVLELLPSIDDLLGQRITTRLSHFSRYAISW
jgi:hypothetical protein